MVATIGINYILREKGWVSPYGDGLYYNPRFHDIPFTRDEEIEYIPFTRDEAIKFEGRGDLLEKEAT